MFQETIPHIVGIRFSAPIMKWRRRGSKRHCVMCMVDTYRCRLDGSQPNFQRRNRSCQTAKTPQIIAGNKTTGNNAGPGRQDIQYWPGF